MRGLNLFFVFWLFVLLSACGASEHREFNSPPVEKVTIPPGTELTFASVYKTIINLKCMNCHDGFGEAELFETREDVLSKPGRVVPGQPEQSKFYLLVKSGFMPKKGPKLSPSEIELIRQWIEAGAL